MSLELEDQIINQMIDTLSPRWDPFAVTEPRYGNLSEEDTKMSDFTAFKFFNSEYEAMAKDNKKIDSIGFDRFVKLYRPEKSFTEDLRNFNKDPEHVSRLWRDVYGSDTGLMKESAHKGYQRALAMASQSEQPID